MNRVLKDYLAKKDYKKVAADCVEWIRNWFLENGPESPAVIGISGGKDSSVVAALCVQALGRERVFGVLMPDGVQKDIEVARYLVQYLGIQSAEVNIHAGVEAVKASMNGRVSNNCNRSENYVGYSTIFGDAAGDFSPLANLTVAEVKEIGRALGLPNEFVDKAPADGLSDKTDEDAFGFTYEQMDTLILTGFCDNDAIREKIERRHAANLFKLRPMPEFNPENGKE